jgi:hypothetical protein
VYRNLYIHKLVAVLASIRASTSKQTGAMSSTLQITGLLGEFVIENEKNLDWIVWQKANK